jgi:hypothetical protein
MVYKKILPLELGCYPPVSIAWKLQTDGFDAPNQIGLFLFVFKRFIFWPVVETARGKFHKPASLPDAREKHRQRVMTSRFCSPA